MINIPFDIERYHCGRLRVNKMRSGLTMLGMIIGVGAVIAMLAVGTGARAEDFWDRIESIGSNLDYGHAPVRVLQAVSGWAQARSRRLPLVTAEAVEKECPSVKELLRCSAEQPRLFMATRTGPQA